jgi:hypothetical protein
MPKASPPLRSGGGKALAPRTSSAQALPFREPHAPIAAAEAVPAAMERV